MSQPWSCPCQFNKLFCFGIENQISICSCVSVLVEQIRSLFRCRIKLVVSLFIIWDYTYYYCCSVHNVAWLMRTSIYILASLVTQRSWCCCCFWRFFTCKVGLLYYSNPTMRQLDRILIGWAPGNGKQSGHKSSMRSNRNSTAMTVTSTIISGRRAKSLIRGLNYEYSATGRVSQPASISAACENRVEYWPLVRTVDSAGMCTVWTGHSTIIDGGLCDWWARFGHCFARKWLIWAPGQYVIDPIGWSVVVQERWLMSAIHLWQNQLALCLPSLFDCKWSI